MSLAQQARLDYGDNYGDGDDGEDGDDGDDGDVEPIAIGDVIVEVLIHSRPSNLI